ncbi:MAG: hypothetical protein ACK5PP_16385 [Acidimicrobiales bacterium]
MAQSPRRIFERITTTAGLWAGDLRRAGTLEEGSGRTLRRDLTSRGHLVLGSAGDGNDWSALYRYLRDEGWRVDLFDAVPQAGGDGVEEAMPPLDGVYAALVVLARSRRRGEIPASGRLHHTVGVLQGQLGFGRVMVLSERDMDAYPSATGVTEVRFDRDDIAAVLGQVDELLAEMTGDDRAMELQAADAGWWTTVVGGRPPMPPERMLAGVAGVLVLATVGLMAWVLSAGSAPDRPVVRAETLPSNQAPSVPGSSGGGVTPGGSAPATGGTDGDAPLGPGPTGTYPTPRPAPTPAPTGAAGPAPSSPAPAPVPDGETGALYPPGGDPTPTLPPP